MVQSAAICPIHCAEQKCKFWFFTLYGVRSIATLQAAHRTVILVRRLKPIWAYLHSLEQYAPPTLPFRSAKSN